MEGRGDRAAAENFPLGPGDPSSRLSDPPGARGVESVGILSGHSVRAGDRIAARSHRRRIGDGQHARREYGLRGDDADDVVDEPADLELGDVVLEEPEDRFLKEAAFEDGVVVSGAAVIGEGVVAGSLQVPPSGQPLVFLADHPTTGGYPVLGVVHRDDLAACAQLRPGEQVSFAAG